MCAIPQLVSAPLNPIRLILLILRCKNILFYHLRLLTFFCLGRKRSVKVSESKMCLRIVMNLRGK